MQKNKKNIILLFAIIVLFSLVACKQDGASVVKGEQELADYEATAYLLDSWKEIDNNSTTYITSIIVYSEDFYDCPTSDDVKLLTENDYKPLSETIEQSEITVYTMNKNLYRGIYTHIKIKSPELLDTTKIYIDVEGPLGQQEKERTKDEYEKTNGSLDGWVGLMLQVSERNIPSIAGKHDLTDSLKYGTVEIINKNRDQFYYLSEMTESIVENNKILTKFFIDAVTESDVNEIPNNLIIDGKVANIIDSKVEIVELDERLTIYCEIIDGELWVGYETVDGSDFSAYDGNTPDAVVYNVAGVNNCFIIKES